MIQKIAHLADIHFREPSRQEEYAEVFEEVYKILDLNPVDRILIAGDIFHTKNVVKNETKVFAKKILTELSKRAKVILINGNHDGNPNNVSQLTSLETLVRLIDNPNITYYNKTGIYEDENVSWIVWDYFDGLNPYEVENWLPLDNTQIDLYHNPVNECMLFTGQNLSHAHSIEKFRGDYFMLGDIHKRQFFENRDLLGKVVAKGAYPGSLVQQDFGESLEKHGFLIWDIKENTCEEHNIFNHYGYVIVTLNTGFNYDDIQSAKELDIFSNTKNQHLRKIRLRVDWKDISANINFENERKIRKFLKEKYDGFLLDLKFKKMIVGEVSINEEVELAEKINLMDYQHLRSIFERYLQANGYSSEIIENILELDQTVSKRFVYEEKIVNWKLLNIFLDNYRSHGPKTELDLKDMNGLIQIRGRNEQGKTNLLSSICYLLYGKTLETLKKEKNGDNRFINNKRNLDYCEVGGILEINSEYYQLTRRSNRKWDKKGEISGVSTVIDFELLDPISFEVVENLNEEQRRVTEKLVLESLGSFEDFLRSSYITADSLNGLLSTDESVFIDSILRDSGLDLFEKKLAAFKDWKKENPVMKPKIDVVQEEMNIDYYEMEIENKQKEFGELDTKISAAETEINKYKNQIKLKQEKIINVDETKVISEVGILQVRQRIELSKAEILSFDQSIEIKQKTHDSYPSRFTTADEKNEEAAKIRVLAFNSWVDQIKPELLQIKDSITECQNQVSQANAKATFILETLEANKREIDTIKSNQLRQIEIIEKQKSQIQESTICFACGRTKETDVESVKHTENLLSDLDEQIEAIKKDKPQKKRIKELEASKFTLLEEHAGLLAKVNSLSNESKDLIQKKSDKEAQYLEKHQENNKVLTELQNLQQKSKLVGLRNQLAQEIDYLVLQKKVKQTDIEKDGKIIQDNKESLAILTNNRYLKSEIEDFGVEINRWDAEQFRLREAKSKLINGDIPILEERIVNVKKSIKLFKDEEAKESVQKLYLECIHRDGIPRMLLSEMRNTINVEISNLLAPLSFGVFFDENMTPKMFDHIKPEATINVIGGSGKQRTFISLALRLALREINNRCVNNIMFMDELMGKLVENSVAEFIELLEEAKQKIEKIFIVEHAYSDLLNPDHLIDIEKNEKGISEIKIIN